MGLALNRKTHENAETIPVFLKKFLSNSLKFTLMFENVIIVFIKI